jgi:hypothetical protein
VGEGHDRRGRHLPLPEVGPDEEHHEDEEDAQAEDGAVLHLVTPAGADLVLRYVVLGDVEGVLDRLRDLGALGVAELLDLDQEEFWPEVDTTGASAFWMPRPPTASRAASACSCVAPSAIVTLYWVPPVNSIP